MRSQIADIIVFDAQGTREEIDALTKAIMFSSVNVLEVYTSSPYAYCATFYKKDQAAIESIVARTIQAYAQRNKVKKLKAG